MLNKLIKYPYNKNVVDRVLVQSKNKFKNGKLFTESDNIKRKVVKHFERQFRKRNHQFERINQDWAKIYEEREEINKDQYTNIMSKITEEECTEVTNTLGEDIASGISGIGYRLIKKVSLKT